MIMQDMEALNPFTDRVQKCEKDDGFQSMWIRLFRKRMTSRLTSRISSTTDLLGKQAPCWYHAMTLSQGRFDGAKIQPRFGQRGLVESSMFLHPGFLPLRRDTAENFDVNVFHLPGTEYLHAAVKRWRDIYKYCPMMGHNAAGQPSVTSAFQSSWAGPAPTAAGESRIPTPAAAPSTPDQAAALNRAYTSQLRDPSEHRQQPDLFNAGYDFRRGDRAHLEDLHDTMKKLVERAYYGVPDAARRSSAAKDRATRRFGCEELMDKWKGSPVDKGFRGMFSSITCGRKVTMVGHSLGANQLGWFLRRMAGTDAAWLEKHVGGAVFLGGPFGGSAAMIKSLTIGEDLGQVRTIPSSSLFALNSVQTPRAGPRL